MHHRLRLAAGLAAAAGLATACGPARTASPPSPVRIPALAAGAGAAPAMGIAEPIAPYPGRVEYRVGGTLPALPSSAPAYHLTATATDSQVSTLARALGVDGTVVSDASGWTVTGRTTTLRVERGGGVPWTLAGQGGGGVAVSGCAVAAPPQPAVPPGARVTVPPFQPPSCPSPTPVPGLPSKTQAEQEVRTDLENAGLDVSGASVEASGGITEWFVSVVPAVDGVPLSGAPLSLTVGPHGGLLSGSGWLAAPVSAGDYPLVGVSAGLDRLRQGGWVLRGGPGPMPLIGVAEGGSNAASKAAPPPQTIAPAVPAVPVKPLPAPVAKPPVAVPPPVAVVSPAPLPTTVLTVTGVHLGLAWGTPAGAASGSDVWLVPVYVFELEGGGSVPVIAVTDHVVAQPSGAIAP